MNYYGEDNIYFKYVFSTGLFYKINFLYSQLFFLKYNDLLIFNTRIIYKQIKNLNLYY